MKTYNWVKRFIFVLILSMSFVLTSLFAQKKERTYEENEKVTKTFKTIKEVWTTPFKSQGETGTCWCFSTTSFLESEAHRLGRGDFELSQMYTVYFAYLEKAQRYMISHAENPLRQGGLFHDVLYIIEKYGAVPRSSYYGHLDICGRYDHREMYNALSGYFSGIVAAGKEAPLGSQINNGRLNWYWLAGFNGLLDAYIGKPPESISYNGKIFSPLQFATEVLRLPLQDYIEITSYGQCPFYTTHEYLLPDNWLHYNKFYNVPLIDFKRIIDYSLENGFSLCISVDISHEEIGSKNNYLQSFEEGNANQINQNDRDRMFDDWRTEDIHGEHIIGFAQDEKGNKFYKAKDSDNPADGNYCRDYNKEYLSERFIQSRSLFIMVHKDGLPHDISTKLGFK